MLVAEIAVGLEPVSVKARSPDEFWVVNELSDSVSIVSLSGRRVIDTLSVPDEPADVTFAAGKAFVTCARNNLFRDRFRIQRPFGPFGHHLAILKRRPG